MVTSHDERCQDCGDYHRLIRLDKLTDEEVEATWLEGERTPGAYLDFWAVMVDSDGIAWTSSWSPVR